MMQSDFEAPSRDAPFVMIVDDDRGISELLSHVFREEGYRTLRAGDGKAALEILQSKGIVPSVILVDLIMPRMGGLEFIERLERDDTFRDIPIILMSGHAALVRGENVRNVRLLPKPFALDQVTELARAVARRTSSRWATPPVSERRAS